MKTCEVLDLAKSDEVVCSLSLVVVLEVQFGKGNSLKSKKGLRLNAHCTALRNDFTGHKIIVTVLSWLT